MTQIEAIIAKAITTVPFPGPRSVAKATALLTALDAAGFVVVPKEPTPEMVNAADERADPDDKTAADVIAGDYRAMIEARPK